jgi:hypothetical protein
VYPRVHDLGSESINPKQLEIERHSSMRLGSNLMGLKFGTETAKINADHGCTTEYFACPPRHVDSERPDFQGILVARMSNFKLLKSSLICYY